MDDLDRDNLLVLTTFAGSVVAVIVGYLLAWRAKRTGDGSARRNLQNCIAVPKSHAAGCSLVRPQF